MRTDELIVSLARAAAPIRPLAGPFMRLGQWIVAAIPLVLIGPVVIGPRADVWTAIHATTFLSLVGVTLLTAILAAAGAFVLSVPGAERSPAQRAMPIVAAGAWIAALVVLLAAGGDVVGRVAALPVHWACVIEIAGLALVPGWILFGMLRRAAPLNRGWSAALAALASLALSAAATEIICPIDDPAHLIVGHVVPVAILTLCGALGGRSSLDWMRNRGQADH